MNNITEVIRKNPELALFFDIYDLLEQNGIKSNQDNLKFNSNLTADMHEQCSIGIQTDTHPHSYHKDNNHTWNLWDLRREAIKLANIQKCETKSTQTNDSLGTQTIEKLHKCK